jgi:hypothetical protein
MRSLEPHGFHFHVPPVLTAILTVAVSVVLLFATWEVVKYVISWVWTLLPPPLAWGNWPLRPSSSTDFFALAPLAATRLSSPKGRPKLRATA